MATRLYTFVLIEDDSAAADQQKALLEQSGHIVHVCLNAREGVDFVTKIKPDVLAINIMMPDVDGLDICRRLRIVPELKALKIIVVSSKSYPADRHGALSVGADGMLLKPLEPSTFVRDILTFAAEAMTITYWGVRGTLPVPGKTSLRYGGNTSCVTLELPRDQFFILDAGSGIRELSRHIMATRDGSLTAKIMITHPHGDHISALPFFVPLYIAGNEFEIMGPSQSARTMREMVAAQMDGTYSPMTLRDLGARVFFRNLSEEEITVGDTRIRTMLLTHPGNCLGYRIKMGNATFCYVTDNELYLKDSPAYNPNYLDKLREFVGDCDLLLIDTTYTDAQYRSRVNWGHSCVSAVADLAHTAGVKRLHLMHHDPEQSDDDIDAKLQDARRVLADLNSSVICDAPAEGSRARLTAEGAFAELGPVTA
jgi:phosphoribosyl 1,2-cyclic phosphodiesterase/ActR/RegA family two-component response regulator